MSKESNSYKNSPKKVYIRTFGCQMNVADSEWMRSILKKKGWGVADCAEKADVVLLNTCSVRSLAEQKVWSKLGELKKIKNRGKKKDLIIGVTGCMAQNYGKEIFSRARYVNIVCGSYRFNKIDELIEKVMSGTTHVLDIEKKDEDINKKTRHSKKVNISSFVPIMRGCNNKCSYCIVPYVRGPERSRGVSEIINEITELAAGGYKEVTLLGQNVNSYKEKGIDFFGLLEEVNKINGIERIRFITSHPKDASLGLFKAIGELDKVCEYLHMPIQSGSNSILKKMNRRYTREHYLGLVKEVREIVPDIVLSTDIIVGFPGESDKDFKKTYDLMKEVGFDSAFIFKYSVREGTPAARLKDDVSLETKKERNRVLLELQDSINLAKNKQLIGKELQVLIEGISKNNKNKLMGRARTNKIVVFPGNNKLIGKLKYIKIINVTPHTLLGKLCK